MEENKLNIKKEKVYFVLVYNETYDTWEIKKQNLWYHEAKSLEEEYKRKSFSAKTIDKTHIKDFLNVTATE